MENISIFDIITVSLILILGIKGVINGFVKEVFGLVGIVGGIFIASRYAKEAGYLVSNHIYNLDSGASIYLVGFITVLLVFWLASLLVGQILERLLSISGLGTIDKLLGFAVGSMKIFLVFSILAVTLSNIDFVRTKMDQYLDKSFMYPIFVDTGSFIVKLDTDEVIKNFEQKSDAAQK